MSTDQITEPTAPDLPVEESTDGNRRAKLLVIAAGGLAVLLAAFYFLFVAGGDPAPVPAAAPKPNPAEQPAAPPAAEQPAAPPVFNGDAGTDPFDPLVTKPAPSTEGSQGSGTGDGTATGTTGSGTSQVLAVTAVSPDNTTVSVTVDGQAYAGLTVGQTFASFYKVYGIFGGTCAGFLYGDSSLGGCVGDTVTVTR
jgi:hypothetical protein